MTGATVTRSTRFVAQAAATVAICLATACSDAAGTAGTGSTEADASAPVTIEIRQQDGTIEPADGRVVEVEQGQPIQLIVTSDVADEIHVHSDPEHEFRIRKGADADKLPAFTLDSPGRFPVESHHLELTLVTLQVS
jgi:hypothetical protein